MVLILLFSSFFASFPSQTDSLNWKSHLFSIYWKFDFHVILSCHVFRGKREKQNRWKEKTQERQNEVRTTGCEEVNLSCLWRVWIEDERHFNRRTLRKVDVIDIIFWHFQDDSRVRWRWKNKGYTFFNSMKKQREHEKDFLVTKSSFMGL